MHLTMDDLIKRIQARVADPTRFLDSATWVMPTPVAAPPASSADVDAAEAAIGFAFPPLLRRLYTEVGNGHWGPSYGFYSIPTGGTDPGADDMVGFYLECTSPERANESPEVEWPLGLVPILCKGCVDYELCDFLSPNSPVFLLSGDTWELDRRLVDSLQLVASSLANRLELWLAAATREA